MLDNTEPTEQTNNAVDSASETPAPAKRAPAKRAPRKAAAKKLAPPEPVVTEPPAEPAAADTDDAAAPAKKATRPRKAAAKNAPAKKAPAKKAPAKKAAARQAAEPALTEPVAAEPTPAEPALTAPAPVEQPAAEQAPAPVKKAARKRVSKKAAAAAEPSADQPAIELPVEPPAAPALAAPAVLFQAPVETKPPTRRRRASRPALAEPSIEQPVEPAQPELDTDELEPLDPELDADSADADAEAGTGEGSRRRRRRGRRGRGNRSAEGTADSADGAEAAEAEDVEDEPESDHAEEVAEAALSASARRRRRRRRSTGADGEPNGSDDDPPNTVVHVRETNRGSGGGGGGGARGGAADDDGVRGVKGSTRLEAKRQRRRDNRDSGRRRVPILTEAEFLARRESVDRVMAVRQTGDRTQIAVLEDDILVEHYVTRASLASAVGNVYLGRVQNVLPSMEAAFIDIGRGRNGVLYAGEVNWDSAGLEGKARSIENALGSGDTVLVQVTKDPIGHKGARLTSQISLPGRFVVYVPGGGMTGISRKLPDTERSRLKAILKKVVPDEAGVIVRTAAEGASEQDLISDVERLKSEWDSITRKVAKTKQSGDGPVLVHGEPDLAIRVVRDIFNDDFGKLIVAGGEMHRTLSDYVGDIAPELANRISLHTAESDLFRDLRVDEQLAKALDRKVWLPSGGSLVIDRTEAMTVVDVNTGKYTGSGGNLEQTVTRNNLEAAEEIVRQLRLRDLGGIVVIDFIDMVLESNRELVLRRLTECLGRDRTKHQVAEVTSLGLVQMTRKRVGEGLLEAFSEPCQTCNGRGLIVHMDPVDRKSGGGGGGNNASAVEEERPARGKRTRKPKAEPVAAQPDPAELEAENTKRRAAASAIAAIAAATAHHDEHRPDSVEQNGAAPVLAEVAVADQVGSDRTGPASTQSNGSAPAADATGSAAPTRPRRRRAASRPAGPPITAEASSAD